MSENVDPDLTELRAALAEAARIEDLAERSLEVVAVVEAAGAPQVLRRAGLVRDEPSGRQRHYHLTAEPLAEVGEWLHPFERYWRDRLRTLADMLEDQEPMPQDDPRGREAFERMGPGWEHKILPALAAVAAELDD